LLSLVVPGLGEAYVDRFETGRYFSGSEVVLWGSYLGMSMYANDFRDDMETFAITNAGAGSSKRGDGDYFAVVGQFQSAQLYNEQKLREGRPSDQILDPEQQWSWKTKQDQEDFDKLRVKAQTLDNDRQFFVAGIVINHVISAIDAFVIARRYNKSLTEAGSQSQGLLFRTGASQGRTYDPLGATLSYRISF